MRNFVIRVSSIGKCPTAWPLLCIVFIAKSSNGLFLSRAHLSFSVSVGTRALLYKWEPRTAAENKFFVVIHADENCFAFGFFTTLMWFECNVIHSKYIQKSLSSGWGEKTKLSREFLLNIFSMKTIDRTLFTSYCLWLTHDLSHVSFLLVCSYPIKFFLFSSHPMIFNVLRHVTKFRNSAVLRLRILPLLRLDYFCKNIHSCSAL